MLPAYSMGSCLCKQKEKRKRRIRRQADLGPPSDVYSHIRGQENQDYSLDVAEHYKNFGFDTRSQYERLSDDVKELIRQTLRVIRTLVNNEQEPPQSLLKLNIIAEKEPGWLVAVEALINHVPDHDSLGPAVITLFLDECPLPAKDTLRKLIYRLNDTFENRDHVIANPQWHKNACIVLGSLAEKLAGINSVRLCSRTILNYLIMNLAPHNAKQVILFSLLALEKFAQTTENQIVITKRFEELPEHPLEVLERWMFSGNLEKDYLAQQVAFCAQWSLDNIFVSPSRRYAYESADTSHINAMLNHEDVSEYLKIGPDGLEARCDVSSFESVRCTFEVHEGVWYYEATILTPGVMQIGFATKASRFLNHEGYGIGDDNASVAYDGCRQLVWHNADSFKHDHRPWRSGDVVGCLLDFNHREVQFYLNGVPMKKADTEFFRNKPNGDGVFAAASFMSFQQCRFNFGADEFRFCPGRRYRSVVRSFNEGGATLSQAQRTILPRRRRLELLVRETIPEDSCSICYAAPQAMMLQPCGHHGFCTTCALMLEKCPLCRVAVVSRVESAEV